MESILKDYIEQQLRDMDEHVDVEPDDDLVLIGFDSVSYVRLIGYIKSRFGYKVPDAEVTVESFGTVAAIASYLESNGINADGEPAA